MKKYKILEFTPQFMKDVNAWIQHTLENDVIVVGMNIRTQRVDELFKHAMWRALRILWQGEESILDIKEIPEHLQVPLLRMVIRSSKAEMQHEQHIIPMFNYNHTLTSAAEIPNIFVVVDETTRVAYHADKVRMPSEYKVKLPSNQQLN